MSDRTIDVWLTLMTVINIGLAICTVLRERQERRVPQAHPLSADLQAIAAAIRERGPDLHIVLPDVLHGDPL